MATTKKRIRIFWSPLGQRFYASSHWKTTGKTENFEHILITGEKFDVTDDIAAAILKHNIEFTVLEEKKTA
jgi:hypothetical protein